jgi:DUF1680 family protein
MTTRRMYVSGGIGSHHEGEAFGKDFELPNERAYTETCAAIGSVMWNWRMLALDGEARYADLIEHTLYNAVLPGVSLDGQHYFYQNPLANDGSHRRLPWFGCACCPPNVARLLASLPGYFYGKSKDSLWVHLYANSEAVFHLGGRDPILLRQSTRYPWDGAVEITVEGASEFSLMLRIPSWCSGGTTVAVNGELLEAEVAPGSYMELRRVWAPGDTVRLDLPMPVRLVESHPYVAENRGRVALMRGPLLYCVEAADNLGYDLRDIVLDGEIPSARFAPDLLDGIAVLDVRAHTMKPDSDWNESLYRTVGPNGDHRDAGIRDVVAIPYYSWANREPGAMLVWLGSR